MIPVIKYISVHLTTAWVCVSLIGCSVFLLMCNLYVCVCVHSNQSGAVDIMVIQQRDDSLKSSPFYVRFGAFSYAHCLFQTERIHIYIYIYVHTRSGVGDASRCMCACTWHFDDGDTDDNAHMGCMGCM